jgi:predicted metal-dependent peptidase
MSNKNDQFLLEQLYSKMLSEAKDLEQHNHSFNEPTKGDNHSPYPDDSYSLESTMEDEDEDDVEDIEDEEFKDVNEKDEEDDSEKPKEESLINAYVQVLTESSKKAVSSKKNTNPRAVENYIEKKSGKKLPKKEKEELVKKIKKSAKHAGKKITSKPVK